MIIFLFFAATMLAIALAFPLYVLLRKGTAEIRSGASNQQILQDQLRELEQDLQTENIAASEQKNIRNDLHRRLTLLTSSEPTTSAPNQDPRQIKTSLAIVLPTILLASGLYFFIGTPKAWDPLQTAALPQSNAAMTSEQIEGMVTKLAEKLKNNPKDANGWRMLTRSYETMRRFDLAVDAYQHLLELNPDDPEVLTDYAVTLAMKLDQSLAGEPEQLILRALQVDPNNIQALALLGSVAFERKDYDQAIQSWKKIISQLPAESDMARSIVAGISKAQALSEKNPIQIK